MNISLQFLTLIIILAVTPVQANETPAALSVFQPEMSPEFIELLRNADPLAGEKIFLRKCSSCHDSLKEGGHGKGPHLWNLIPRKAGSLPGFEYSEAMQNSGHSWTLANLNYYLIRTDRAVPGLSMNFRGIRKDSNRADLIRYLWTLNDSPPPLP